MIEDEIVNGFWFLPQNPNSHFHGQLTFGPSSFPRLALIANKDTNLSDFPFNVEDYVIWGLGENGIAITLLGCNRLDASGNGFGFQTSIFNAQRIIIGDHINSEDELLFDSVEFSLENLEEWVNIQGFNVNVSSHDSYQISYERPKDLFFHINDQVTGNLCFRNNTPFSRNPIIRLSQENYFELKFNGQLSLKDVIENVWRMRQFITLMMFEETKIKWINVIKDNKKLKIFYKQSSKEDIVESDRLYLISLRVLGQRFELAIKKWFEIVKDLDPVIAILHSNIGKSQGFYQNDFLNMVQAVEAFDRRQLQDTQQLQAANEPRLNRILQCIEDQNDKKWLSERLTFSYEPNLRTRLTKLCVLHKEILFMDSVSKNQLKPMIMHIVETRNYYTHFDPSLEKKKKVSTVINQTFFLKMLLTYCILDQIGLDSEYLMPSVYHRYRIRLR